MNKIVVGKNVKLIGDINLDVPKDSIATIIFIDEFDQVFIDWVDGGQSSFSEKLFLNNFEYCDTITI